MKQILGLDAKILGLDAKVENLEKIQARLDEAQKQVEEFRKACSMNLVYYDDYSNEVLINSVLDGFMKIELNRDIEAHLTKEQALDIADNIRKFYAVRGGSEEQEEKELTLSYTDIDNDSIEIKDNSRFNSISLYIDGEDGMVCLSKEQTIDMAKKILKFWGVE